MSSNNECANVLDDSESDTEELIYDLDAALGAALNCDVGAGLSLQASRFVIDFVEGKIPNINDPDKQELINCWADKHRDAILDLRRQFKWFLDNT